VMELRGVRAEESVEDWGGSGVAEDGEE